MNHADLRSARAVKAVSRQSDGGAVSVRAEPVTVMRTSQEL